MRRYTKRNNKQDYIIIAVSAIVMVISIILIVFFITDYNKNNLINNEILNNVSAEIVSSENEYSTLKQEYEKSYSEVKELSDELAELNK